MAVNGILLGQNDTTNKDSLNLKFYKNFVCQANGWTSLSLPNNYFYKVFITDGQRNWGRNENSMNLDIFNSNNHNYYYYQQSFLTNYSPRPTGVSREKEYSSNSSFSLQGYEPYSNTQEAVPLYLEIYAFSDYGYCIVKYPNLSEAYVEWSNSSLSLSYYNRYKSSIITAAKIYRMPLL